MEGNGRDAAEKRSTSPFLKREERPKTCSTHKIETTPRYPRSIHPYSHSDHLSSVLFSPSCTHTHFLSSQVQSIHSPFQPSSSFQLLLFSFSFVCSLPFVVFLSSLCYRPTSSSFSLCPNLNLASLSERPDVVHDSLQIILRGLREVVEVFALLHQLPPSSPLSFSSIRRRHLPDLLPIPRQPIMSEHQMNHTPRPGHSIEFLQTLSVAHVDQHTVAAHSVERGSRVGPGVFGDVQLSEVVVHFSLSGDRQHLCRQVAPC
mmetsp:Transcript_21210/g.42135  ORF Transcript_21210/g.42135 Transcript_21210/m.42135 type:complete len:260 (-) Transcript_21210:540-1319(-)